MNARTGRPKTDNPKNIRLEIRLDKSTNDILQECANKMNTTKTDVIVKGISLVEECLKK